MAVTRNLATVDIKTLSSSDKILVATSDEKVRRVAVDEITQGYALETDIPTLVSELENDAGYLTQHQDISGKQNTLTAGANITIVNDVISATGGSGGGYEPDGVSLTLDEHGNLATTFGGGMIHHSGGGGEPHGDCPIYFPPDPDEPVHVTQDGGTYKVVIRDLTPNSEDPAPEQFGWDYSTTTLSDAAKAETYWVDFHIQAGQEGEQTQIRDLHYDEEAGGFVSPNQPEDMFIIRYDAVNGFTLEVSELWYTMDVEVGGFQFWFQQNGDYDEFIPINSACIPMDHETIFEGPMGPAANTSWRFHFDPQGMEPFEREWTPVALGSDGSVHPCSSGEEIFGMVMGTWGEGGEEDPQFFANVIMLGASRCRLTGDPVIGQHVVPSGDSGEVECSSSATTGPILIDAEDPHVLLK